MGGQAIVIRYSFFTTGSDGVLFGINHYHIHAQWLKVGNILAATEQSNLVSVLNKSLQSLVFIFTPELHFGTVFHSVCQV